MERDEIKAVGYVRVSTDSQVRHGYSLDEQREEIVRYCNNQQYALLEIFSDDADIIGLNQKTFDLRGFTD